ncbi:MAG: hypothetical protein H0U71_05595 [Gammaproteobacteria bacterium]|nr:hypothetical protein [Gammaproteobacteria bacterium]
MPNEVSDYFQHLLSDTDVKKGKMHQIKITRSMDPLPVAKVQNKVFLTQLSKFIVENQSLYKKNSPLLYQEDINFSIKILRLAYDNFTAGLESEHQLYLHCLEVKRLFSAGLYIFHYGFGGEYSRILDQVKPLGLNKVSCLDMCLNELLEANAKKVIKEQRQSVKVEFLRSLEPPSPIAEVIELVENILRTIDPSQMNALSEINQEKIETLKKLIKEGNIQYAEQLKISPADKILEKKLQASQEEHLLNEVIEKALKHFSNRLTETISEINSHQKTMEETIKILVEALMKHELAAASPQNSPFNNRSNKGRSSASLLLSVKPVVTASSPNPKKTKALLVATQSEDNSPSYLTMTKNN